MSELNMTYFEDLRSRINQRLIELDAPHRDVQIRKFPWLYGALGAVPSEVMLICENPSLSGVRSAHIDTVDGRAPDIEAQWWGGRNNPAAKRFRPALRQAGLKTSRPDVRGGWRCYITNVVKEANVAGAEQRELTTVQRQRQAREWADILAWEYSQVRPTHVFAVGRPAYQALQYLLREGLLPQMTIHPIGHYSARGKDELVMQQMLLPLLTVLDSERRGGGLELSTDGV